MKVSRANYRSFPVEYRSYKYIQQIESSEFQMEDGPQNNSRVISDKSSSET